jgi:hypothetical protein
LLHAVAVFDQAKNSVIFFACAENQDIAIQEIPSSDQLSWILDASTIQIQPSRSY